MHHVVYRSDGVARAALGAAKKIDLTAPKSGRWPLETREADLGRMTDSWSPAFGTSCEPESRGVICQPALVRGARFTPGSGAGALRACAPLQSHLEGRWTVADRAFDSNGFRRALASTAAFNCIPPCSRRRTPIRFDRELYRHRHVVENFFSRIKRHRRIATRYEKLAVTFHGFVCFAAVLDWLNHEV
jgi:transposase